MLKSQFEDWLNSLDINLGCLTLFLLREFDLEST